MDNEFEEFLMESEDDDSTNYVASFDSKRDCQKFLDGAGEYVMATWVADNNREIQFETNQIDELANLIENTNADLHIFDGDVREMLINK